VAIVKFVPAATFRVCVRPHFPKGRLCAAPALAPKMAPGLHLEPRPVERRARWRLVERTTRQMPKRRGCFVLSFGRARSPSMPSCSGRAAGLGSRVSPHTATMGVGIVVRHRVGAEPRSLAAPINIDDVLTCVNVGVARG
jgi:hypothetical protein